MRNITVSVVKYSNTQYLINIFIGTDSVTTESKKQKCHFYNLHLHFQQLFFLHTFVHNFTGFWQQISVFEIQINRLVVIEWNFSIASSFRSLKKTLTENWNVCSSLHKSAVNKYDKVFRWNATSKSSNHSYLHLY